MDDPISRQAAIDKFEPWLKVEGYSDGELNMLKAVLYELRFLPSVQPEQEEFEWCHDCKEYDQQKHCCHRWTKVIRQTVAEIKDAQPEPKWIPCSENLPIIKNNIGTRVLITTSWGLVKEAHYCVDHWEMDGISYKLTSATAWMPLPEGYKGEQE